MVRFFKFGAIVTAILVAIFLVGVWLLGTATPIGGAMRCYIMENYYDLSFDPAPDYSVTVGAVQETEPVLDRCDAADDPAIWVDPQNPVKSLIIGTNKQRSLNIYNLSGELLSRRRLKAPNNVDIRTGVPFAGESGILIGASTKDDSRLQLFSLDPEKAVLEDIEGAPIVPEPEDETYGFCFYQNQGAGKLYAISTDKSGVIEQWELTTEASTGGVASKLVRQLRVDTQPEGCVADDANGYLYVGEEDVGVWRFHADPGSGDEKTLIALTGVGDVQGAQLSADVEGLAIYAPYSNDSSSGYLIASSQGNHSYVLFDRLPPHEWRGTFQVSYDGALAGDTDGLDVTALSVGPDYPQGMLVIQDGIYKKPGRAERNQNFKYVSWSDVATALSLDE